MHKHIKTYERFIGQPAYHGSPYDFNQFVLGLGKKGVSKELNWGWGLYFASQKDLARYYADVSVADDFYGSGLSIKINGEELKDTIKEWASV